MGYIRERLGIKKNDLTGEERILLSKQLKKSDRKRIDILSFLTLAGSIVFILLDFFVFNDQNQNAYLFFDVFVFIVSLSVVLNVLFYSNREAAFLKTMSDASYTLFPAAILIWAVGILMFDAGSLMNIVAFFFAFFIIVFAVLISFKQLLIYFAFVFFEYSVLVFWLNIPFLNETFVVILLTMVLCLPFYYIFRYNRFQLQLAFLNLDKLNHSLEKEVENRVQELKNLNLNLEKEIGQRKIIEQKLRDALKKAESSDQLKSEFLANISHEIRTPLNAIIGFSEMITEEGVPPQGKKKYADLIGSNTMYLLSTIDDIFDASLIKTEQINPILKSFYVDRFLATLFYDISSIKLKYHKEDIELITKVTGDPLLKMVTDEYFLKKALIRLIDNAFKFTNKGVVEVGAQMLPTKIVFYVKDTGIGIKKEDREKIFEPFVQSDGTFTRGFGGSGLGLSIVMGIVNALDCKLDLITKENSGTEFIIVFSDHVLAH